MSDDLLPFVHVFPSLADEVGEPLRLEPEVQAEVDRRLCEIDEARAAAMSSASTYVIWR